MEIWKDVPKWEGKYMISSLGRVKSCKRIVQNRYGDRIISERILKLHISKQYGYPRLQLNNDGRRLSIDIHLLMAIVFLGHNNRGNKLVVDHVNSIKTDNRLDNLRIVSARFNLSKDRKNKTSVYTGVCTTKQSTKYRATITVGKSCVFLGGYLTEIEANKIYLKAVENITKFTGDKKAFRELINSL